ncbi:MAG: hypothetical protein EOO41_00380 [Methanobacteriota archaeon]|nr:MAG: hypothetical protein EOO41_00380 [Euryarchaeota archaeon]
MTLGATSVTDVLPTDRLCDVLKDGDEVFVALCVKPTMDGMNVINHTAWQREAFHAQDDAIAEQAVANALAQERSMYKPDSDVSWDADVATRLRDVLHVEPSTPMPPAAAAFGVPAPSPTYTTDAYSETVLETSERGVQATERWNPEAGASLPLWRESPEPLSNFDGDWRAMKTTSLWADQKELDSARAVLARAYPSLLEMFRLYATLGNVTSASKLPATGGSTPAASPTSPSPSAVGAQRAVAATRRDSGGRFGAPAPAAAASAVGQAAASSPALRAGAVYEEPLVLTAAELEIFLRYVVCGWLAVHMSSSVHGHLPLCALSLLRAVHAPPCIAGTRCA